MLGTYKCPNRSLYDGEWKVNKKHGKGTVKRPDGSMAYDGEWKDGLMHGNGTHNYSNGDVYTGEWSADKYGNEVMTYANQDRYDGEWKEDDKHGKGTMKFHNGDV